MKGEVNERMITDHDTNSHIADRCGGCSDDKVEDVAGVVGRLGNVLNLSLIHI